MQIEWELNLDCVTCGAHIHITSELGDKFKLSRDRKTERLLKEAETWINNNPQGATTPYPLKLDPFIIRTNPFLRKAFTLVEHPTRYVKCPVCKERVYVY